MGYVLLTRPLLSDACDAESGSRFSISQTDFEILNEK
jgi:hypothetical protein